jgi:hypothetical protein
MQWQRDREISCGNFPVSLPLHFVKLPSVHNIRRCSSVNLTYSYFTLAITLGWADGMQWLNKEEARLLRMFNEKPQMKAEKEIFEAEFAKASAPFEALKKELLTTWIAPLPLEYQDKIRPLYELLEEIQTKDKEELKWKEYEELFRQIATLIRVPTPFQKLDQLDYFVVRFLEEKEIYDKALKKKKEFDAKWAPYETIELQVVEIQERIKEHKAKEHEPPVDTAQTQASPTESTENKPVDDTAKVQASPTGGSEPLVPNVAKP